MARVLVIAPHPDDEVLGVGGSILQHIRAGDEVHVVICTRGRESRFGADQVQRVLSEAKTAHKYMGLAGSHFLDLPAAELDTVPLVDINTALSNVFKQVIPDTVYLSHLGDVHHDHQVLFQSAMVCMRPTGGQFPTRILAYETVSETDWYAAPTTPAFIPNVFQDIEATIEGKLEACSKYESQIRPAPDQRSLEAIRALSVTRGSTVGLPNAEAFVLIREILK